MSGQEALDLPSAGFYKTWLSAIFGDFIIFIRLLAYVLLLCAVPSVLAAKVSQFLGTASAIFLTSVYIFFQMDVFEQSVETPIRRASQEVESPSSERYDSTVSYKKSNVLRRVCGSIGNFIDYKKNLPKEILDNLMIPWADNESSCGHITGPKITQKKFKILFFLLAVTIFLLILLAPGFNALGPIAVSKYLISNAVQSGIAHFATALLFGGFVYVLRAPLVAAGIAIHYFLTKDSDTKNRLKGLVTQQKKPGDISTKNERPSSPTKTMYLKLSSPSLSPVSRDLPESDSPNSPQQYKRVFAFGKFDPKNMPDTIIVKDKYLDKYLPDKKEIIYYRR